MTDIYILERELRELRAAVRQSLDALIAAAGTEGFDRLRDAHWKTLELLDSAAKAVIAAKATRRWPEW